MRYIDADKLLEVLNGFTQFHHIETLTVGTFIDMIADIPTAKVREDSWAIGKDNRYLDLTKVFEYFRSKKITELKFFDGDIVHEFKMVVRGEWREVENDFDVVGYYCSNCDLPMPTEERTNYCPNCGARMRETEVKE